MIDSTPNHVWYVAYGSNLAERRLQSYLDGTTPPGAARPMRGARDPTPPRRAVPCRIPGQLRFARRSRVWGGGIAFYDPAGPDHVWARRYLISWSQFEDLFAQENGRPTEALELQGIERRRPGTDGSYRQVVVLEARDGHPSITFTDTERAPTSTPSASYLTWVVRGLVESHVVTTESVTEYLLAAPGVVPHWSRAALARLARRSSD